MAIDYKIDEHVARALQNLQHNSEFKVVLEWIVGLGAQGTREAVHCRDPIDQQRGAGAAQLVEGILGKIGDSPGIVQKLYTKRLQPR